MLRQLPLVEEVGSYNKTATLARWSPKIVQHPVFPHVTLKVSLFFISIRIPQNSKFASQQFVYVSDAVVVATCGNKEPSQNSGAVTDSDGGTSVERSEAGLQEEKGKASAFSAPPMWIVAATL